MLSTEAQEFEQRKAEALLGLPEGPSQEDLDEAERAARADAANDDEGLWY